MEETDKGRRPVSRSLARTNVMSKSVGRKINTADQIYPIKVLGLPDINKKAPGTAVGGTRGVYKVHIRI